MSAASPSPTGPAPTAPPAPPRTGEIHDLGSVRRDSVRAQRWTAKGADKVLGDAEVDLADLSGLVSIRGTLSGGSVTTSGTLDVGGAVRLAGALTAAGTTTLDGDVLVQELLLTGSTAVSGRVEARGRCRWKGSLEVAQGVTAERVEFEGRGAIEGAVRAKEVEGRVRGPSRFGSIVADRVRIHRPTRLFGGGHLEVLTIEAKDVELEGVHAQYVKAERVAIGAGCQIAQVDGTISRQHPSSHVGPAVRSPTPYGLTR